MMAGLRTWWSGAVGTTPLTLHVSPISLLAGAAGAIAAAMGCIWWTLRGLARISERQSIGRRPSSRRWPAGRLEAPAGAKAAPAPTKWFGRRRELSSRARLRLIAGAAMKAIPPAGAFFGAGASILIACLCFLTWRLRASRRQRFEAAVDRAPRLPQHDRAPGTQRARDRRHRLRDLHPDLGRRVPARRHRSRRPPIRHRRLSAARRPDAAARPRSELARRPRGARPRRATERRRSSRSGCCRATTRAA